MRIFGVVGTAVVFLAFGTVSGFAFQGEDHPRQEEAKPEHPAEHPKDARPAEHPQPREESRPQQHPQEEQKRAEQNSRQIQDNQHRAQEQNQKRAEQDNRRAQEDNQHRAQQDQHAREAQQKQAQQNQRAQEQNAKAQAEQQHRAQQDRDRQARDGHYHPQPQGRPAAYHGRIPEQRFHERFGREHHFHFHRPEIYQGRPRFQYSGYWFYIADPWPSNWSYDDDVYVDYVDDQYYLFDPVHPALRIVINVDL